MNKHSIKVLFMHEDTFSLSWWWCILEVDECVDEKIEHEKMSKWEKMSFTMNILSNKSQMSMLRVWEITNIL